MAEVNGDGLIVLAARCESATGRDRVLDGDIAEMLNLVPGWAGTARYPGTGSWDAGRDFWDAPGFSSSLDAAVTLVPEGYDWAVFRTNGGLTAHAWCGSREDVFGDGPALALSAAALRARAALSATPA